MISLTKILNKLYLTKFSFYLLLILIVISFSITFYLMLPNNELVKNLLQLQYFLLADVFFVILLLALIIRQLVLIIIYRRNKKNESKLYIKFVNLFTAMALGPTIGLVVITSLFFNLEFKTWYGDAVREAIVNSNIVAKDYENEIQAEIISDTQLIMREIVKVSRNNEVNMSSINRGLSEFINLRTISNIYLFNRSGEIYLNFKDKENQSFLLPSKNVFETLDQNRVYIFQLNKNSISAYKKINFLGDVFMQVNREFKSNIWDHVEATKEAYNIYTTKENESAGIQITYSMIFVLFSLGFILIAVLIGFNLARKLSKPISNLIESANEISKGNFNSKVSEIDQFEEIKVLISTYNKMIVEIESQQNLLITKSNEDEEKRLFIEAILSLLTIGVVSLDSNFKIIFFNQTANNLFKKTKFLQNHKNFLTIFSEWSKIFHNFNKSKRILENFQTEILIKDDLRSFNVRIIKEFKDNKINGYIVSIDDTTSFILAEKHAAWSDIARKIAHEVKNPLTPIKLSAERIEKKYLNKDFDNDDIKLLTRTISRQVDDIGKLIDEFSSFARMPEAEMKIDNISKCLNESFLLFSNSHRNIKFNINLENKFIYFQFDKFQLSQCFNNLIKNAVEAVEKIPNPSISINLKSQDNKIFIEIIDNGIGISNEITQKIFEPYFTTKSKGTGLGLSIVKKIIEDHNGKIRIDKNKQMAGTSCSIFFENINV